MTGNSPVSGKSCGRKQNSSDGSNKCSNKTNKVSNGMSLLSMWKIQGSQNSSTESAEDDMFLPSKNFKGTPRKAKASPNKPRISPKPSVYKTSEPGPNSSQYQGDTEYCPNCQMPFAALIKQSQNWHLTECMDFDFQHLKECPLGESCSSTIPSHYMKYTHYGLARLRSGIPQTPANSLQSKKLNTSPSPGKPKAETLTPCIKRKNLFLKKGDGSLSQNISPRVSNQLKHVSPSGTNLKNADNRRLSVCKSTHSNTPSNNGAEEKCRQSQDMFSGVSHVFERGKSSIQNSGLSKCSSPAKSPDDGWETSQEFQMPDNVPLKTLSSEKISPLVAEKNQNRSNWHKRLRSDALQASSPMDEELNCFTNTVSDSKMCNGFGPAGASLTGSSDSTEDVTSGVQRNIKRMKLNDSWSHTNNFVQSDGRTQGFSGVLEGKALSQSSTPKGKQLDLVCSKTDGGGDTNDFQQEKNILNLADDWFPRDEFNTGDATEKNFGTNEDSEEELSIIKDSSDVSKKMMVQTAITKTSSADNSSNNMALSQVKPEKLTPQKKPKNALQAKNVSSPGKTEPSASPRKKQTSLMSFFKSSSSHSVSPQKMTFVGPTGSVKNNKSSQHPWSKVFQPSKAFNIQQKEQNNGVQGNKTCPFYRKIPGTTFAVDAFSYGSIPGIHHYFLSHFHYDHYCGLTKKFQHPVYCSVVTANLVSLKIRLPQKYINTLMLNETVVIENVTVTILDANHCPGSVMFLFGLPDGRFMLHTGDFRATPAMELYPSLKNCRIERLFLDTTYCNPCYDFPSQDTILDMLTSLVVPRMKSNAKLLVVCGSYTIGKEKAFMAIAESVDCKIWADASKRNILNRLEDPRISSRLVTDEKVANIHVCPMWKIKVSHLHEYLMKFSGVFNEIIGLKPTGWEHNSGVSNNVFSLKPLSAGPITIYGIPYSEHSSFSELKKFVQFIKPKHVVPTVNVGNAQCRNQMAYCFQQWLT